MRSLRVMVIWAVVVSICCGAPEEPAERVEAAVERLPLVDLELDPGSGVFFHCNLLHRSDANTSDDPRWTLICCYNAARNDPYRDSSHPRYEPLAKLDDEQVIKVGRAQWARMDGG